MNGTVEKKSRHAGYRTNDPRAAAIDRLIRQGAEQRGWLSRVDGSWSIPIHDPDASFGGYLLLKLKLAGFEGQEVDDIIQKFMVGPQVSSSTEEERKLKRSPYSVITEEPKAKKKRGKGLVIDTEEGSPTEGQINGEIFKKYDPSKGTLFDHWVYHIFKKRVISEIRNRSNRNTKQKSVNIKGPSRGTEDQVGMGEDSIRDTRESIPDEGIASTDYVNATIVAFRQYLRGQRHGDLLLKISTYTLPYPWGEGLRDDLDLVAEKLTQAGVKTGSGSTQWSSGTLDKYISDIETYFMRYMAEEAQGDPEGYSELGTLHKNKYRKTNVEVKPVDTQSNLPPLKRNFTPAEWNSKYRIYQHSSGKRYLVTTIKRGDNQTRVLFENGGDALVLSKDLYPAPLILPGLDYDRSQFSTDFENHFKEQVIPGKGSVQEKVVQVPNATKQFTSAGDRIGKYKHKDG